MNLTYLEIDHNRVHFDRLNRARGEFFERLIMSWIYHELALEGVVLTQVDLLRAYDQAPVRTWVDSQVQQSVLRLREAFHFLYDAAAEDRPVTVDFIRELHIRLSGDSDAAGRYRKRDTSPGVYNLHIVPSSSVSYHLRKLVDTINTELASTHALRAAAIAHHEFMRIFPFDERSGLVGRLLMNYMLIKAGYPPAVIHAMDRPQYFAALDGHPTDLVDCLIDAVSSTITAAKSFSSEYVEPDRHKAAL